MNILSTVRSRPAPAPERTAPEIPGTAIGGPAAILAVSSRIAVALGLSSLLAAGAVAQAADATGVASAPTADVGTASDGRDTGRLMRTLLALDAEISHAYNTCALGRLRSHFSPLAEFYYAGRGISRSVGDLINNARRDVCGKLRRETLPAAHAVYPLEDFGALLVGEERFCGIAQDGCEGISTRFVAVWRFKDGQWRIVRLIRYGYDPAP